jgi:MFS family permease
MSYADSRCLLRTNVLKLNIFAALKMSLFPMAIITLFWKDHIGLSLTEILVLQVFFSVASVLMEYPSGYLSDRWGYRTSLILACILGIMGWSFYLVAASFAGVLLAELILGASLAFISGSDTALLYETLQATNSRELYMVSDGRMTGAAQLGEATAALSAGAMYALSPLLPFQVQIGVWITALILCISLKEPPVEHSPVITSHLSRAAAVCREAMLENRAIRTTMLYGTLLGLSSFYMVWLVQPYMQQCEVPLVWFGPVWAGANLAVVAGSLLGPKLFAKIGLQPMSIFLGILVLTAYFGLGLTTAVGGFLFYYLLTLMRGMQGPILRNMLQAGSTRHNRASILSLHSLTFRTAFVLTGPLVGLSADVLGLQQTFLVIAGVYMVALPVMTRAFLRARG